MDRLQYMQSLSQGQEPDIVAQFFDHFLALKQIVQDKEANIAITDVSKTQGVNGVIIITLQFKNKKDTECAIRSINQGSFIIYGKQIMVSASSGLEKNSLKITLS